MPVNINEDAGIVSAEVFRIVSNHVVKGQYDANGDGRLSVGGPLDRDRVVIDAENNSVLGRRFQLRRALLRMGAEGDDGDIVLYGGGNDAIDAPSVAPSLHLDASQSRLLGRRFQLRQASLRLGANDDDGDITLYRGDNGDMENPTAEPSLRLDAETSGITGDRFQLRGGILRVGADGDDGDIQLYDGSNGSITAPSGQPTLHLNGSDGSVRLRRLVFADGTTQNTATDQGPRGPRGPEGPRGPQGNTGPRGPAGSVDLSTVQARVLQGAAADRAINTINADGTIVESSRISSSSCDRALKTDMAPAEDDAVLDGFAALPLHHWRYRAGADRARHIGPTAQDFKAAFGLDDAEDGVIAHVDAHGVAFAGIRALRAKVAEQAETIAALSARLAALEAAAT